MTRRAELHAMLDEILDTQAGRQADATSAAEAAFDRELVSMARDLMVSAIPGEFTRTLNRVMNGTDDPIVSEPQGGEVGPRGARLLAFFYQLLATVDVPSSAVVANDLRSFVEPTSGAPLILRRLPGKIGRPPRDEASLRADVLALHRIAGLRGIKIGQAVEDHGAVMVGASDPHGAGWKEFDGVITDSERDEARQEGVAARGDAFRSAEIYGYTSTRKDGERRRADPRAWEKATEDSRKAQLMAEDAGAPNEPATDSPPNWDQ
jgi:hypothetical protein